MNIDLPVDNGSGNILITGGRAPVALELARLLHGAGHRVFVAESAAYHLCRVSAAVEQSFRVPPPRQNPEGFIAELEVLVRRFKIDLLVPMCEEIFYIARGLDLLGSHCRVLCSPLELLHGLHHKAEFISRAKQLGLTVPATELIASPQEWSRVMEAQVQQPQRVFKPVYSRFASKVIMPGGAGKRGPNPAAPSAISQSFPWVAQQYIQGAAICTYSIVHEGTVVAHAAYGSQYRTGQVGASVYFEALDHPSAMDFVRRFVQEIGFSGQIGFDFIEAEDGTLYPIECNPRATSGLHLFAPADNLPQALLSPGTLAASGKVITPHTGKKVMLALPMLACGLTAGRGNLASWWEAFRTAGDAVHRGSDLRPSIEQLRIVYKAWRLAAAHKLTMTEALTEDIEWNGER